MAETCSKCATLLDEDAVFCPSCATPVIAKCPNCQKLIKANAKFCKYCAFDLSQSLPLTSRENLVVSSSKPANLDSQYRSGIDSLLADKYRAMSDSELVAMLRGDLSGHTQKTLSLALKELETRTNIDWRDVNIARSNVSEAINSVGSVGSTINSPRFVVRRTSMEKADRLAKAGGITAAISVLLFIWGYNYTSNFANSARASLMNLAGQTDSTYQLASLCLGLSSIGFLVGLILFIIGMVQRSS